MKKINGFLKLILAFSLFMVFSIKANNRQETSNVILRIDDLLKIIVDYEKIMNNKYPTLNDFNYLYFGDHESERGNDIEEKYCGGLGLQVDTKPCVEAMKKLINSYGKDRPDLYLLNIKYIITDSKDIPIDIYVDAKIKQCYKKDDLESSAQAINAIARIGNNKYKKLLLALPCDIETSKYWKIDVRSVDGKWIEDYPLAIKAPDFKK